MTGLFLIMPCLGLSGAGRCRLRRRISWTSTHADPNLPARLQLPEEISPALLVGPPRVVVIHRRRQPKPRGDH
jgi:hypothetical protein